MAATIKAPTLTINIMTIGRKINRENEKAQCGFVNFSCCKGDTNIYKTLIYKYMVRLIMRCFIIIIIGFALAHKLILGVLEHANRKIKVN